jgi:hypothetical protein
MPSNDKRTADPDLSEILEGLLKANIAFILVGGLATVVQGAPITTLDVDIVHSRLPKNIVNLMKFLRSVDAVYRRPDDKTIAPKEEDFAHMGHALLSTRLGPLDVLAFIEEGKTYEDLIAHTIEIPFRGHRLRVLDLRTLIAMKIGSKDLKDKRRLPLLEETLRQIEKK